MLKAQLEFGWWSSYSVRHPSPGKAGLRPKAPPTDCHQISPAPRPRARTPRSRARLAVQLAPGRRRPICLRPCLKDGAGRYRVEADGLALPLTNAPAVSAHFRGDFEVGRP